MSRAVDKLISELRASAPLGEPRRFLAELLIAAGIPHAVVGLHRLLRRRRQS